MPLKSVPIDLNEIKQLRGLVYNSLIFASVREYMSSLLSKTYGGVVVRAKALWFVAVQTKTHGLLNIYRSG